ncbi:hypothetical protein Scep_001545 [Stephania cephalantha]|uniref:Uncharacterized protein n=1 Tax=Stephania cephalantha TaxID=152367 RepID=A0AAP0LBY8_9MAGN
MIELVMNPIAMQKAQMEVTELCGLSIDGDDVVKGLLGLSDNLAAGSQTVPSTIAATKWSQDRQALNAMIDIVAPKFKEQFGGNDPISVSDLDADDSNQKMKTRRVEVLMVLLWRFVG